MISPGFQEDFLDLVNGVYHVLYMLLRYVFHLLTEPALEMIYIDIIIVISQIRQFQDIYPSVIPALPLLHHSHVAELIHQLRNGGHGTVHGRCHITDPDNPFFLINNMNTPDNADVPGLDPVRKIRQNLTDSASLMTCLLYTSDAADD